MYKQPFSKMIYAIRTNFWQFLKITKSDLLRYIYDLLLPTLQQENVLIILTFWHRFSHSGPVCFSGGGRQCLMNVEPVVT